MKKLFFAAAALAAMTMVSCNKEDNSNVPEMPQAKKVQVALQFSKSAPMTRAAGDEKDTEAERTVNHIDVFFFRQDANRTLDAYYGFDAAAFTQEGEDGAFTVGLDKSMWVSDVTLDVYAIANAPAAITSAITSVATMKAQISQFTANTASNFIMIGRLAGQNIAGLNADAEGVKHITGPLELERMANKILFKQIKKDFVSPAYQNATVTLEGAFVINAPKQAKYAEVYTAAGARTVDAVPAAEAASYYHAGLAAANTTWENNPFLGKADINQVVTATGTALNTSAAPAGFPFYFYPNPALESTDIKAEDYVTKLTLKVKVETADESHIYWYPIAFNQAKYVGTSPDGNYVGAPMDQTRNLIYVIDNITLKKAGNNFEDDDPNKYIDNSVVDVKITVLDWVTGEILGSYNNRGWGELN